MHAALRLVVLVLLSSRVRGFRIYKERQALMNLLVASGEAVEERLFMEHCKHSTDSGNCNLATDGHIIIEWTQCSSTAEADNAWWLAKFETPSYITRVVIHTTDLPDSSMTNGFTDFAIIISGIQCYRHVSSVFFLVKSFPCDALGDQLTVQSYTKNGILSLCEVEAYGVPLSFQGVESGTMELRIPTCEQSSTVGENECSHAIDRQFVRRPSMSKACAKTERENYPWWAGYFREPTMITHVKVFSQEDCCSDAFRSFSIKVNDVECKRYEHGDTNNAPFGPTVLICRRFGNYIQVQSLKEKVQLSLCQVQAFGHKILLLADTLYSYLGCFKDNPQEPDFEQQVSSTWMSPAKCHRICKRNNKAFFGLQNGQVCFCGGKYGRHGKAMNCTMPCKDDRNTMCGGRGFNSVYEILL